MIQTPRVISDRMPGCVVLASSIVLLITVIGVVWAAPMNEWNDGYLAPTFAMLSPKYRLYTSPEQGPVLSTIYPPIGFLAYLPAVLAPNPSAAILIAATLSVFIYIAPFAFVAAELVKQDVLDRRTAIAAVVLFVLMGFVYDREILGEVKANIPGAGLCMLGVWALLYGRRHPGRGIALAALCFAGSVWAYQQMVPGVPFGFVATWLMFGRRRALQFAAVSVGCCLTLFGVFCLIFGGSDMMFNIWTLPKSHPWVPNPVNIHDPGTWIYSGNWGAKVKSIAAMLETMWRNSALVWTLAIAVLALFGRKCGPEGRGNPFSAVCLLFALGIVLVPTTTLAAIKVGGSPVSYEIALYFIIATVAVGLAKGLYSSPLVARTADFRHYVMLAALSVFSLAALPLWEIYFKRGREPWCSTTAKAYLFLKAHPGQVYFPTLPLCHLMANNELTHSEAGIFDRELDNFVLSRTAFDSGCPARFSFIAYHGMNSYESIVKHFNLVPVKPPLELSDWLMFRVVDKTSQ